MIESDDDFTDDPTSTDTKAAEALPKDTGKTTEALDKKLEQLFSPR